jgi:hypothetical protein
MTDKEVLQERKKFKVLIDGCLQTGSFALTSSGDLIELKDNNSWVLHDKNQESVINFSTAIPNQSGEILYEGDTIGQFNNKGEIIEYEIHRSYYDRPKLI